MIETSQVVIVGEAPGHGGDASKPLEGRAGRRLAKLAGISYEEYLEHFVRVNLFTDKPKVWRDLDARKAWQRVQIKHRHHLFFVLLGRRVASAAFGKENVPFFRGAPVYIREDHLVVHASLCVVAPHPSGLSRWWNDPRNVRRARHFWRQLVARLKVTIPTREKV